MRIPIERYLYLMALVVASLVGVLLLTCLTWNYLGYEYIPNLVKLNEVAGKEYDFIIVGAGTVGSVLAKRLSSSPNNHSVLLIEAGTHFGPASTVPLLALAMQKSSMDWSFVSTSQKHSSRGLVDNKQFLPRGKGLGGSSQMNYLLHFDGIDQDFETWQSAGAEGWGSRTMRPYLNRINNRCVHYEPKANCIADENSQTDNCLKTDQINSDVVFHVTPFPTADDTTLAAVFTQMQHETKTTRPHLVFQTSKSNTYKGTRWSTYHAYLRSAFSHPNLNILTNTRVARILFDDARRATTVLVRNENDGDTFQIHARREIILSTGAYNTPHLLKLSGVGPPDELALFKLPLIAGSPKVGRNLHEHLTVPLYVSINASLSMTTDKIFRVAEVTRYLTEGTGLFSRFGVVGFVSDTQLHHSFGIFGAGSMEERVLRDVANCKEEIFRAEFPLYLNTTQEGFVFLNTCHQPQSRGTVKLNSRSSKAQPSINPNFLADPADVQCIIRAIRMAVETLGTPAMRAIDAQIHWPKLLPCLNFGPMPEDFATNWPSDRYLECVIRTIGVSSHHPGGTCAIGATPSDCVDSQLNVRGVHGLRVADASVLPTPISGTPNTVLTAVGERAADLILSDHIIAKRETTPINTH